MYMPDLSRSATGASGDRRDPGLSIVALLSFGIHFPIRVITVACLIEKMSALTCYCEMARLLPFLDLFLYEDLKEEAVKEEHSGDPETTSGCGPVAVADAEQERAVGIGLFASTVRCHRAGRTHRFSIAGVPRSCSGFRVRAVEYYIKQARHD